jgi:hypothetical protein
VVHGSEINLISSLFSLCFCDGTETVEAAEEAFDDTRMLRIELLSASFKLKVKCSCGDGGVGKKRGEQLQELVNESLN